MFNNYLSSAYGMSLFASTALSQSVFINIDQVQDHVYDHHREVLYVSTSFGTIERYSTATGTRLSNFAIDGTSFNGIDVSADGQRLYAADTTISGDFGVFQIFNTGDGSVSSALYKREFGEDEAWDVAVTNRGFALTTTEYGGSGRTPMRRLYEDSFTYSEPIRDVRQRTNLFRSADRRFVFYMEGNHSGGPMGLYDAELDMIVATSSTGTSNSGKVSAVSRHGERIAYEDQDGIILLDNQLNEVDLIAGYTGGVGFSPIADIVFVGDQATDEVVAYDMYTLDELDRYILPDDLSFTGPLNDGVMSFSDRGDILFITTANGVSMVNVIPSPSSASVVLLLGTVRILRRRRAS